MTPVHRPESIVGLHLLSTVTPVGTFAASPMILHILLQVQIKRIFQIRYQIASVQSQIFLSSNGQKLNEDKTHLLTIPRKTGRNQINSLVLDTSYSKIQSSISEKLLGILIHRNLKWADYIIYGEDSLTKSLPSK